MDALLAELAGGVSPASPAANGNGPAPAGMVGA
jgi:hypothetical protein